MQENYPWDQDLSMIDIWDYQVTIIGELFVE